LTIAIGLSIAVAVAGAIMAVTLPNILHAVFGLAISLMGIAGMFFCLGSPFVAAMEVLVYVGGISVAMVFAVMLSYSISAGKMEESRERRLIGALPALLFLVVMVLLLQSTDFGGQPAALDSEQWTVAAIGRALLTHYNLVFEMLSLVLLVAIVGAIAIAREDEEPTP